ncbi:MAG TPA: class I SAM-dependent methyltransferase [Nitrospiria bacterium]|nr:class I SAM-dependent methyltransferase [Nitrospiria bacterium]
MNDQAEHPASAVGQIPRSSFERVRPTDMVLGPWSRYGTKLLQAPAAGRAAMVDVGCGACQMSRVARDQGWIVTALDAIPSNIDHAKTFGFEAIQADFNAPLPLPDAAFDHAMMIEVIEHIVNAELLVREVARILKPGGRLLMTTPNNAYYRRRIRALQGKPPDDEGYHFRFFVKRRLLETFERSGFRLVATNSFGFLPLVDAFKLRKLRGAGRTRFVIPPRWESVFADRFVWLLEKQTNA